MATFDVIQSEEKRIKYVIGELKFLPLTIDAGSKLDQGRGSISASMIGRVVDENNDPIFVKDRHGNPTSDYEYVSGGKSINADLMTEIADATNEFTVNDKQISAADILEWFIQWTDKKLS